MPEEVPSYHPRACGEAGPDDGEDAGGVGVDAGVDADAVGAAAGPCYHALS